MRLRLRESECKQSSSGMGSGSSDSEAHGNKRYNYGNLRPFFTWESFLSEGVDAHFVCRKQGLDEVERLAKASDYWKQVECKPPFEGYMLCPKDLARVAIYSRTAFLYPLVVFTSRMPDLSRHLNGAEFWIGFENGSAGGNGFVALRVYAADGATRTEAVFSRHHILRRIDVTNLMPTDYQKKSYTYSIQVGGNMAAFSVENRVMAFGLYTPAEESLSIPGPPYAMLNAPISAASLTSLVEASGLGKEVKIQLSPYNFRLSEGNPLPPRTVRLYRAGSSDLLAGITLGSGSVTSHGFPVYGYAGKTIFFQSDKDGALQFQVLTQTGNWRVYDAVSVSARKLECYALTGDAVVARVVFTPNSYPATIEEAEVVLR